MTLGRARRRREKAIQAAIERCPDDEFIGVTRTASGEGRVTCLPFAELAGLSASYQKIFSEQGMGPLPWPKRWLIELDSERTMHGSIVEATGDRHGK